MGSLSIGNHFGSIGVEHGANLIDTGASSGSPARAVSQTNDSPHTASLSKPENAPSVISQLVEILPIVMEIASTKGLRVVGNAANAVTGIKTFLDAVREDHDAGEGYQKSAKTLVASVAQISAGNVVGGAVAAGSAALLGTAGLPIVLGAAAGAGASYLVGKLFK